MKSFNNGSELLKYVVQLKVSADQTFYYERLIKWYSLLNDPVHLYTGIDSKMWGWGNGLAVKSVHCFSRVNLVPSIHIR